MDLDVLADGLGYVESPRWHDGKLWLSDFDSGQIKTVDARGGVKIFTDVSGIPSGLAFTGDSVLVASMQTAKILTVDKAGAATTYADLSGLAVGFLNDVVLSNRDVLYVGCFGYDLSAREKPRPGPLLAVKATGQASVVCPDITFANGMVTSSDGDSLFVAESARHCILRFTIRDDGSLTDRCVFADLGHPYQPDGLCADADGGIWLGSPFTEEFLRLDQWGSITHVVPTPGRWAIACALGGPDGTTFFGLTAETDLARFHRGLSVGRVEVGAAPYPARS